MKLSHFNLVLLLLIVAYLAYDKSLSTSTHFTELTVERLNVVGADGNKYIVLSNPKRQALATNNGEVVNPNITDRDTPGLIFFDQDGNEVGGLVYGIDEEGTYQMMTFDQYQNDQIMVLRKDETKTDAGWERQYGLQISERSEKTSLESRREIDAIEAIADSVAREKAWDVFYDNPENLAPTRMFVGRLVNEKTGVFMLDKNNRLKLSIYVTPEGQPKMEYVDSLGKKVNLIPN